MEYILNAKERNQAFMQFIMFFLVIVTLIAAAMYFNFRVPVKENESLIRQINVQDAATLQQEKFLFKMNEVVTYIDSLDRNGVNVKRVGIELDEKFTDLADLQVNENAIYESMNGKLTDVLLDIRAARQEVKDLRMQLERASEYEAKYNECANALDNFRRQELGSVIQ